MENIQKIACRQKQAASLEEQLVHEVRYGETIGVDWVFCSMERFHGGAVSQCSDCIRIGVGLGAVVRTTALKQFVDSKRPRLHTARRSCSTASAKKTM